MGIVVFCSRVQTWDKLGNVLLRGFEGGLIIFDVLKMLFVDSLILVFRVFVCYVLSFVVFGGFAIFYKPIVLWLEFGFGHALPCCVYCSFQGVVIRAPSQFTLLDPRLVPLVHFGLVRLQNPSRCSTRKQQRKREDRQQRTKTRKEHSLRRFYFNDNLGPCRYQVIGNFLAQRGAR